MYTVTGTIEGAAPLLFSRPYKVIDPPKPGKQTDEDRDSEAMKRLHLDVERGAYIPSEALKNSLLDGIKMAGIKNGAVSARPLVEATVFPLHHVFLGKSEPDEVFETPARVPPRTGPLVLIRYPKFLPGWKGAFTLLVTQDSRDLLEKVRKGLETAGQFVGVGSWRPEYGRFVLIDWNVSQN